MSPTTSDPNDPRLGRGVDDEPVAQQEAYLVLSEEERAKGFVRPYREVYRHVGPPRPAHPLHDLTEEQQDRHGDRGYIKYEAYENCEHDHGSVTGRFWTLDHLAAAERGGCGTETRMAPEIAETYARNPRFYGATYCVRCRKHRPLNEFEWLDGSELGS